MHVVAQISDMHIRPEGQRAFRDVDTARYLTRAVEHLAGLDPRPAAVLATGDLVESGTVEEYRHLRRLLAPLPMPVYLVPGNHDRRDGLRAVFADHGYLPPRGFVQYVIEDGPLRLVGLDTSVPGQARGRLCPERLKWVDERLSEAPDRPTLVFMHHPPFPTGIAAMDALGLDEAEAFGAVVARHPQVEAVVCGHLHRPIHLRWRGTVVTTAPGPAHQVALDLRPAGGLALVLEPPAVLLHVWRPGVGLVTHTSYIGDFGPPHVVSPPGAPEA